MSLAFLPYLDWTSTSCSNSSSNMGNSHGTEPETEKNRQKQGAAGADAERTSSFHSGLSRVKTAEIAGCSSNLLPSSISERGGSLHNNTAISGVETEALLTPIPPAQRTMSQKSSTADTPSEPIRCAVHTSFRFGDIATLVKHLKEHHGTSCLMCDKDLRLASISKKRHRQQCHPGAGQSQTSLPCPICGKSQLSHCELNNHLTTIHGKSFCCLQKICGFRVSAAVDTQLASGVSKPVEKRQQNKVVVASQLLLRKTKCESVAYKCSLCAWTVKKTTDDLTRHMKVCHPAVCLLCGVDTGNGVTARKEHLKAVHSNAPSTYHCHLCDPGPILKAHSQYANHMTQAHGFQFCCKSRMCIKSRIVVKSDLPKPGIAKIAVPKPVSLAAVLPSQRPTVAPSGDVVRVPTQTSARVAMWCGSRLKQQHTQSSTATSSVEQTICCFFHPTQRFEDTKSLRQHLYSEHASACLFCGVELGSENERIPHNEMHHVGHNDSTTKEPCCICGKDFAAVSRRAHLLDKHHQTFCCAQKLCGVGQSAKTMVKPQMELKVDRTSVLRAEAEFRCVLHQKRLFPTLSLLPEHVKVDHAGCCMFCGNEANSRSHRNVAHPDRLSVAVCICGACGKRSNSHEQFCNHLRDIHGQPFCCIHGLCGFQMMQLDPSVGSAPNTEATAFVIDLKPEENSLDAQSQENVLPPGVLRLVRFVLSQRPDRRMTATQLTQMLKDSYGVGWGSESDLLNLVINGRSSLAIETSDSEEGGDVIWIKIKPSEVQKL